MKAVENRREKKEGERSKGIVRACIASAYANPTMTQRERDLLCVAMELPHRGGCFRSTSSELFSILTRNESQGRIMH